MYSYLTGRLDTGHYTGAVCCRFTGRMAGIRAAYWCARRTCPPSWPSCRRRCRARSARSAKG
nr:MAG TPA: hypothetical protein [Caudoviricetes sp.]